MILFVVPGKPHGKARPRMTKSGHTYTPKNTVDYEKQVQVCYITEHKGVKLEGAITAYITAIYGVPKSASKATRAAMLEGCIRPTKKPDVDNIAKAILDSLNGLAYDDDSQVVRLSIDKAYGIEPCVMVALNELKGDEGK